MWGEEHLILRLHGRSPLGPAPRTRQVRGPRRKDEVSRGFLEKPTDTQFMIDTPQGSTPWHTRLKTRRTKA